MDAPAEEVERLTREESGCAKLRIVRRTVDACPRSRGRSRLLLPVFRNNVLIPEQCVSAAV